MSCSHGRNYLVRHLIGFPQIDYDEHADLLMKPCGQMLRHLRSYLPDERAVALNNSAYASGQDCEPDFVVETDAEKIIAEIKRRDEIHEDTVQAKARAASKWVGYANAHARQCNGKPWTYALIPHDFVGDGATLQGLVASHARITLV